jgi:hypothetical protein
MNALESQEDDEGGSEGTSSEVAGNATIQMLQDSSHMFAICLRSHCNYFFALVKMGSYADCFLLNAERRNFRFDSMEVEDAVESALRMEMMKEIDERLTSTSKQGQGAARKEYLRPFFSQGPRNFDDRPLFGGFCYTQVHAAKIVESLPNVFKINHFYLQESSK